MMKSTRNLNFQNWLDAWDKYLDNVAQFDINHNAPQWQREKKCKSDSLTKSSPEQTSKTNHGKDKEPRSEIGT